MPEELPDFAEFIGALRALGLTAAAFRSARDSELVSALEAISALRHEVERHQALAAAEVSRRSRATFGQRGLARRDGHVSAGAMLQSITHSSKRDAVALATVGALVAETEAAAEYGRLRRDDPAAAAVVPEIRRPWYARLGEAVVSGELSVAVAEAIRSGFGELDGRGRGDGNGNGNDRALEAALEAEVAVLVPLCRATNADAARRAARQARDRVDAAGVDSRAASQREQRYWRVWLKPDGMVRGEFELDAETGMYVKAVFDQLTHPRLIEPRVRRGFGDPLSGEERYSAAKATRERAAADGLVQLLQAGASVDPTRLLNTQKPSVRVVVNERALATGRGSGVVEGHPDRIPVASIHTGLCEGHLPVLFDDQGACLDLGRDERLFTPKQKVALAIRDGGCMDPGCTRPPSWSEAHHIRHWQRDDGRTDLADGILLCREAHLRYHNEGWEVRREGAAYWLIPPPGIDPEQRPRPMRPKTPADVINPIDASRLPAMTLPPPPSPSQRAVA